ncbi:hypothetical protein PghCCS26_47950 [Paenibacillus glycanilyticus]|uniref:HTH cro/C1-type domain-containing protein n=1 Tax=Paenibacillus glycanilyticus TaxID=126569 RepID=A0ABQ6NSX8_9BACL|nr:hypothetical protein PghCCS26_47950 [Paenibacillus glycanilyticus]
MFRLGKKRSKFGAFIDEHGISQEALCQATGLNKKTLSRICNEDDASLRAITRQALIEAVRKLTGNKRVKESDFWDV